MAVMGKDAAIEKKDVLKARAYSWSPGEFGRPRCWHRDVSDADKAAAEASWLRVNVMGSGQAIWALRITAKDRYSDQCRDWGEREEVRRIVPSLPLIDALRRSQIRERFLVWLDVDHRRIMRTQAAQFVAYRFRLVLVIEKPLPRVIS
jgi:hypothetical protein